MADTKKRNFSFVFHNVNGYDSKHTLEAYVKSQGATRYLCGCEAYGHQDGYHTHLFVSFENGHKFGKMIKNYQDWALKNIVAPKPPDQEGFWGRVEVSKMFGTYAQAKAYLEGLTKDKLVDPDISEFQKPPKGYIECDVCHKSDHHVNMAASYYKPRGLGRCRMCNIVPHRLLQAAGHQVKNLDYMWEI